MKEHLLDYINTAKSGSVRGLRILVEYFYALEIFEPIVKSKVRIVSVFGSARTKPGNPNYTIAKKLGKSLYESGYAVVTGASAGIMQAANEGAVDGIIAELKKGKHKKKSKEEIVETADFKKKLGQYSVGLKISLPFEPDHNPYLGVFATFHYFMVRKFFFGTLSSAFIACEGGWGTRDELFEILTLVQTGKAPLMPIIYISKNPKHLTDDVKHAEKTGMISPADKYLLNVVPNYQAAVKIINRFYSVVKNISYEKKNVVEIELHKPLSKKQRATLDRFMKSKGKTMFTGFNTNDRRIAFKGFNYRSYGNIRMLIDQLA
jgi:uncharacterized protein (TIGR00730 family)